VMFTVSQNQPDSTKKSRRRVAKSTYSSNLNIVLRSVSTPVSKSCEMLLAKESLVNTDFLMIVLLL
jgi:hypothetical protein